MRLDQALARGRRRSGLIAEVDRDHVITACHDDRVDRRIDQLGAAAQVASQGYEPADEREMRTGIALLLGDAASDAVANREPGGSARESALGRGMPRHWASEHVASHA